MKILKGIVISFLVAFVLLFMAMGFPWFALAIGTTLMENPPSPEITYGEFPIMVEYEVDGEVKVIEDTVICEFDGFIQRGEAGKRRLWKSNLKSGNERLTLFKPNDNIEFFFSHLRPEYYMDDMENSSYFLNLDEGMLDIPYITWKDGVRVGSSGMLLDEAWEKYKIRIISFKYAEPINNTFN